MTKYTTVIWGGKSFYCSHLTDSPSIESEKLGEPTLALAADLPGGPLCKSVTLLYNTGTGTCIPSDLAWDSITGA